MLGSSVPPTGSLNPQRLSHDLDGARPPRDLEASLTGRSPGPAEPEVGRRQVVRAAESSAWSADALDGMASSTRLRPALFAA
jgi:hypothetical protein